MSTYRERRAARADRLREWSDKRADRSRAAFDRARTIADGIPLGQPILVGHHSEKRHRRDIARIDAGMRAGVEHQTKAADMARTADEIERQAETAIYSDDVDAVEQLAARIAALEADRERIKQINREIRKGPGYEARITPPLTPHERAELLSIARHQPYYEPDKKGFPPYVLQNLGGNITRQRKRLEELTARRRVADALRAETPPAPVDGLATADDPIAAAGLQIIAGRTNPSKPWKKPRPVWTVAGNVIAWGALLARCGGHEYHGRINFWEDPTAAITRALRALDPTAQATTEAPAHE